MTNDEDDNNEEEDGGVVPLLVAALAPVDGHEDAGVENQQKEERKNTKKDGP